MQRQFILVLLSALFALHFPQAARAQRAQYEALVAAHAKANAVPEALVHRVIMRESRYQAALVGRGGCIGLMQIKLATARGLGYTGDAAGLRDPDTNLTYGVKYLAGAYRTANGDHAEPFTTTPRILLRRQAPAARPGQAPRRRCSPAPPGNRPRRTRQAAAGFGDSEHGSAMQRSAKCRHAASREPRLA